MVLVLGMCFVKIFNGIDFVIFGFLFVNGNGEVFCYQKVDCQVFVDFLFVNFWFEKSFIEKDKYGYLECENGVYYFKLNLKIGLLKRQDNEGICIFLELKCFLLQIIQIEI